MRHTKTTATIMKANTLNKIEEKIEREQTTRAKTIAQIRKRSPNPIRSSSTLQYECELVECHNANNNIQQKKKAHRHNEYSNVWGYVNGVGVMRCLLCLTAVGMALSEQRRRLHHWQRRRSWIYESQMRV